MYWELKNLNGWSISSKLPVDGFKWPKNISRFYENFIKAYKEGSGITYFLNVDVKYAEQIHELDNKLPFASEIMNIEQCKKLLCSLYDKKVDANVKFKTSTKSWIRFAKSGQSN